MFLFSAVVSAILLLVAFGAFRWSRSPSAVVCLAGAPVLLFFACLGAVLPVAFVQALVLLALVLLAKSCGWQTKRFAWLSGAATLAVYGGFGFFAYQDVDRLRQRFPYQSLEARLPLPKPHASGPLAAGAAERLAAVEELLENKAVSYPQSQRRRQLEQLHEHTLQVFATRPGFGVGRMQQMSVRSLGRSLREDVSLPQPGTRVAFTWSSGDFEGNTPELAKEDFDSSWRMHLDGLVDFVRPDGFGYVKDRRHVAGFQSHGFSKAPVPEPLWALQTVDLVGLLQHDEPAVYVTDHLPRMEELRDAPWRHADDFEVTALQALRRGADLFVRDGREGRRMLGALRNAAQCSACHGGDRGDLLGAFSYTLTRAR